MTYKVMPLPANSGEPAKVVVYISNVIGRDKLFATISVMVGMLEYWATYGAGKNLELHDVKG